MAGRKRPSPVSKKSGRAKKTAEPASRPKGRLVLERKSDLRPQTARTKVEEAMEARLSTLDPGSLRHGVLFTAIAFKRSWLELARLLSEVSGSGEFKEWGYRTFEAYVSHELHIRKDTAQKLLRSYNFLAAHERPLLDGASEDTVPPLPSYQALDVLAEARSNPYLNERDYRELRDQVFREDPSPAQVRKIVRERAPESVKKAPVDPLERVRKALAMAERLYGLLLEEEEVGEDITRHLEKVVGGLRKIVEE